MSAFESPVVDQWQPEEAQPIRIDAETLETTAPEYLRDIKYELSTRQLIPARVVVGVHFDADGSLAIQEQIETVREHIRVAAFLGAGTLTVRFDDVSDEAKVRPALTACVERARLEGVTLDLDGPITVTN